jgi:SynChlorMet cassette protein ScmC
MPKANAQAEERNVSIVNGDRCAFPLSVMKVHGPAGQKENSPSVKTADKGRYLLRLGNGHSWEMVADEGASHWMEKFASILRLGHCGYEGNPQLVFTRKKRGSRWTDNPGFRNIRDLSGNLPSFGWKIYSLRSIHLWTHFEVPNVVCELEEGDHELDIIMMELSLFPVYIRAVAAGGLPLHTALVERDGKAFFLPAAGGTGKSTCCRRIPRPWRALSDDLSLAVADGNGGYRAHPFPTWSNYFSKHTGGTWDVQRHLPLSAVFFLEQGEADEAVPLGQGQASALIAESAVQICHFFLKDLGQEHKRRLSEKIIDNACALSRSVPAFRLRVSMNGQFWEKMEAAVRSAGSKDKPCRHSC